MSIIKSPRAPVDILSSKLSHLQAMLMMTYGNGQDPFDSMSDVVRDNYMWACAALVDDCIELVESPAIVSGVSA